MTMMMMITRRFGPLCTPSNEANGLEPGRSSHSVKHSTITRTAPMVVVRVRPHIFAENENESIA